MEAAETPERESMEYDVVIVGAGPAGLAAAIRLKELDEKISVVVLEKGSEVGAHILSGAVIDPIGLDKLIPDWRDDPDRPLTTHVTEDRFLYLTEKGATKLPNILMPKLMNNHGSYIGSLGRLTQWLAARAEGLGVEIYPGFAAAEILTDDKGAVIGVATGDMGIGRDGKPGPAYQPGMALLGRYTLIGEGARGSLAKELIARFALDEGREPAKFGIGLKELWEVEPDKHKPGLIQHSFGWPLDNKTGGGSFLYHFGENQVAIGFVVHLNYENPHLEPFQEFQRFKTHPAIKSLLEGGQRVSYGARAITEGGIQSVPKLVFPGGALIGCSAGFVNVPRIKGTHNAMLSGMLAAEHVAGALGEGRSHDTVESFEASWRESEIGHDLKKVRNVKPLWSRFGTRLGVMLGGLDMWTNSLFGFSFFGTMGHEKPDYACLKPASECPKIDYPKPDGVITFDKPSSVFLSNTNHEEDQPVHLRLADPMMQKESEWAVFAGPSARYCPAGVYEWVQEDGAEPRFVINAQNCVHCKTCDIKDPNRNITWVPPQGGEGPIYVGM
ncbi:electron transfer flavoprotein-ubiquinone oxidoreductase [Afifella sp. JA880]|uniref:electron transfer flavoprotein-ubiquinone oxidoreductase n=1 Tax=Afifella sp. JA880 TaxID=2975280 RepID=UPI0021BA99C0|nr:electron transfer flavoprotein-ubiquinone oxidoreductase [Afifella sp. JA880]MCT8266974.1 electron transfer flavoprotein-ubiquinone oxidoreductase [Afifella sp. JA880]